jgi:coatomer subunit beta
MMFSSNDTFVCFFLSVSKKGEARPPLRQYMMDGDFFIGAALGTTLTKLALRYMSLTDNKKQNRFCSEAMLIMASILHLGKSGK